jgi:hypothetical protein
LGRCSSAKATVDIFDKQLIGFFRPVPFYDVFL